MSYQKQQWTDEVLAGGKALYTLKNNADGTIINDDVEIIMKTPVEQPGTLVLATRMNHMENGIEAISQIATGLKILGFYSSVSELQAAVEEPAAGDAYGIGTAYPYDIYIYSETALWVNAGQLQGAPGAEGQSAYEVWIAAGNEGTETEFLESLKGAAAFSVAIGTVTTGAAGSSAAVTNVGTVENQIWDITIPQGTQGETGAEGPQGEQGPQGVQGVQGIPGPQGAAAFTLAIGTVTTGAAGSSATVTNSGTDTDQVWDVTIPQGAQGAAGPAGQQGPKGDTGATGPQGPLGLSMTEVTLTASAWSNKQQTISVSGVTASSVIIVSPKMTSFMAYTDARCYASAVGAGTVTFSCDTVPAANLTVYVMRYMG